MKTYTFTLQTQRHSPLPFLLAWVAFSTMFLTSCTTIRVPPSDSTPPTVNLSLLGEDVMVTSNGTRRVVLIDIYDRHSLLVAGTDEDGGVQRVWIEGSVSCGCVERGEGWIRHPTGHAAHNSEGRRVEARPGDTVKITLIDALNVPEEAWSACGRCTPRSEDFHFIGEYIGHTENFSGRSATTAPLILQSR